MAKAIAMRNAAPTPALDVLANPARYTLMPWACMHAAESSEIRAYAPVTGDWETVAAVHDARGIDAEATAEFVVRAINNYGRMRELLFEAVTALELCLACGDRLTWEAEHEAQVTVLRAKRIMGE